MSAGTPRNNLEEVLKRSKDQWTVQSPAIGSASSSTATKARKFKPAAPPSTPAGVTSVNVTVRRPVAATFSTPGFRAVTSTTTTTNVKATALTATPKANYAQEAVTGDSNPSSPSRGSKRTSAEFAPMCDESPRSKRLRKENEPIEVVANHSAAKKAKKFKPVPTTAPSKGSGLLDLFLVIISFTLLIALYLYQQTKSVKASVINIDDDIEFDMPSTSARHRPVIPSASTSTLPDIIEPVDVDLSRQQSSTLFGLGSGGNTEHDIPLKHMDLLTEPQESLVQMLKQDNMLNKTIMDSIYEHHSKTHVVDLQILEHIRDLLNDRVKAINDVLKLRKASGPGSRFASPMPGTLASGSSIRETLSLHFGFLR
ncbi:hypothetical protein BDN72DRAFT_905657 [Pluteus cervinus]|uniref:Uncharacterized protein n=1 Tax=Pluteus cervinus TaxID=181527 RepID=A0ACD3A1G2_9AGAR|nr:hypothetical protein BDN72DRAFT_905657 [Pluteus cervinus]